ncbi:helix-turn-helix domain-containing protein [Metabacillus sp. JX24]|uniref:helix-turn-helix domain-containing protein n=1 Tax=Metabacillus sp. JX24 TaxID=3240759 RepID=UPI003510CE9A
MKESKVAFVKFNTSLMRDYELKVGETLVYGALVSFRNMSIQNNKKDEQGQVYAYPPISSIANMSGQSERSVKSHIQVLEQKGLMKVKRSYKAGGKEKNVNRYYLNNEVLQVYFTDNPTETVKTVKPKTKGVKGTPKESKQMMFIADANIEKWFTHYQGEINSNSAKRLNQAYEEYGVGTVVKAIHNAMNGVNINTLTRGTTGFILSRLTDKDLGTAKRQLQNEKERNERFANEPTTPTFDYKAELRKQRDREEKKEARTNADPFLEKLGLAL